MCLLCWHWSLTTVHPNSTLLLKTTQEKKKETWVQDTNSTTNFWLSFVLKLHKSSMNPKTLLRAQVTPWHPMALVEKRRGGLWLSVHAWVLGGGWLCSTSRSLNLSVLGLTRRFLELKSALLIFLLSMLTGGFQMVSSPWLLRGYLVLTAWHLFGFRSLNEQEAKQGKIFWPYFILDMIMLWITPFIFFFVSSRAARV